MHHQKNIRRNRQVNPSSLLWIISLLTLFLLASCTRQDVQSPTVQEQAIQLNDLDVSTGQTIYVPAYSEMNIQGDRTVNLAVTLAVHNTDFEHPIILTSVKYYGTQGQLLKEYLTEPQQLGPLASTDFFVEANQQSDGLGTNFIVEWVAEQPVFEPIVEAIMLNTTNQQGISLTSPGRVINQIAPQEE